MEIRFTKNFVDPGVRTYASGDTAEVEDHQARALIHHSIAVPVIRITKAVATQPKRKREIR